MAWGNISGLTTIGANQTVYFTITTPDGDGFPEFIGPMVVFPYTQILNGQQDIVLETSTVGVSTYATSEPPPLAAATYYYSFNVTNLSTGSASFYLTKLDT